MVHRKSKTLIKCTIKQQWYGAVFNIHGRYTHGKDRQGLRAEEDLAFGLDQRGLHRPPDDQSSEPCLHPPGTRYFRHNMEDYDATYRDFRIDVPEYLNFGFDVIDAWAKKDRNKLAMIWTNQKGEEKKFTFWDLMRLSNQIVNMLIKYGVSKGDRVMIMLPRVPGVVDRHHRAYQARGGLLPGADHAHRTRPEVPD